MEVVRKILSYFQVENAIDTGNSSSLSVKIVGLLPHLILRTDLVVHPFYNDSTEYTLENIDNKRIGVQVLKDADVLQSVTLKVRVKGWPMKREDAYMYVLLPILRVPQLWRKLELLVSDFNHTKAMLEPFRYCFQYLERFSICASSEAYDLLPPSTTSDSELAPITTNSVELVYLSLCILPALCNTGILNSVRELVIEDIHTLFNTNQDEFCTVIRSLSHILSGLPYLDSLTLSYLVYHYFTEGQIKVKSSTLRSLQIRYTDGDTDLVDFLEMFSNCPIDSLIIIGGSRDPLIEKLAMFFPGLKELVCVSCFSSTALNRDKSSYQNAFIG